MGSALLVLSASGCSSPVRTLSGAEFDVPVASTTRLHAEAARYPDACVIIDPTTTEKDVIAWYSIQQVFESNRDLYDKYVGGLAPGSMLGIICNVDQEVDVAKYARKSMLKAGFHGRVYIRMSLTTAEEFTG